MTHKKETSGTEPIKASRRGFVSGVLGLGAAAIGVATLARSGTPEVRSQATRSKPADKAGYHETEHIRSYYRSAS